MTVNKELIKKVFLDYHGDGWTEEYQHNTEIVIREYIESYLELEKYAPEKMYAKTGKRARAMGHRNTNLVHDKDKHGRGALERLVFQRLGYVGCSSAEQVAEIVDRACADPPPVAHSHSWEECGMCLECDAAWVLDRREEELENE